MGPLRPGGGRDLPLLSVYVWRGVVVAAARCGGGRRQSGGVVVVAVAVAGAAVGGGGGARAAVGLAGRAFFCFLKIPSPRGTPRALGEELFTGGVAP
jgi:hypothetical protein